MIKKVFRQMLVTQIVSTLTVMICLLVDSILIGRYLGINAMTAYGLTNPVLMVFVSFGTILSAGIQVMCGKTMGSGDREGTDANFTLSMAFALGIALLGILLVIVFLNPLCTSLGAGLPTPDNEVYTLTKNYLTGFIFGAPAFILAQIMVPYMQMSGNRVRVVVAVLALTIGDIVLDLLNVFVFHGGMLGMGLASSASYYIALIIGGAYFFHKDCMFHLNRKGFQLKRLGEMLYHGIPTAINSISLVLLVYCLNKILLGTGGNEAVAGYSVISTVGNICYSFGGGIGSTALMLGAIFYGDEDKNAIYTVIRTMVRYSLIIDGVLVAVVLCGAPYIVRLFLTDNVEAVRLATQGLRFFTLSLLICPINVCFKNFYQGIGHTKLSETIAFLESFFFPALSAFVLSRFLGTTGVWLCWIAGELLCCLTYSAIVWKKNGKVSFTPEAYAMLPEDFGARPEDSLDVTVYTVEESMEASMKAAEFCKAHGESERNCVLISLCIEEMVNNIVEHGFTKDQKEDHAVEVRLMFKEDKRLLRIRDNCVNFDPVKYLELHETDEEGAHVGIRMVMGMVKEANYVNSLGLNNLTLVM